MSDQALDDDLFSLSFAVKRSVRYHAKRAYFFNKLNQLSNMISILLASALISNILDNSMLFDIKLSSILGVIALIVASIVIVFDATGQAQKHYELSKRFTTLEKNMLKQNPTRDDYIEWKKERLSIETEDINVLHVLNTICHNELIRAEDLSSDHMVKISILQRLLSPIMDFRSHTIKKG